MACCSTFLTLLAVVARLAGTGPVPGAAFQRVLLHALTLLRAASSEGPPGTGCSQIKRKLKGIVKSVIMHELFEIVHFCRMQLLQKTRCSFYFGQIHLHSFDSAYWCGRVKPSLHGSSMKWFTPLKQDVVHARTRNVLKQTWLSFWRKNIWIQSKTKGFTKKNKYQATIVSILYRFSKQKLWVQRILITYFVIFLILICFIPIKFLVVFLSVLVYREH